MIKGLSLGNTSSPDLGTSGMRKWIRKGECAYVTGRKSSCKIDIGAELVFVENPEVKVVVCDDRKVEYNNEITSLTAVARQFKGYKNIAGPSFFTYNGRLATEFAQKHNGKISSNTLSLKSCVHFLTITFFFKRILLPNIRIRLSVTLCLILSRFVIKCTFVQCPLDRRTFLLSKFMPRNTRKSRQIVPFQEDNYEN